MGVALFRGGKYTSTGARYTGHVRRRCAYCSLTSRCTRERHILGTIGNEQAAFGSFAQTVSSNCDPTDLTLTFCWAVPGLAMKTSSKSAWLTNTTSPFRSVESES